MGMITTTLAQRFAAAAALTVALMLLGLGPAAATAAEQPGGEQRELDGWIYGRGLATYSGGNSTKTTFSDDGWARGQGMRASVAPKPKAGTFVDGWAVAQGMRAKQRSFVDGWAVAQGMRSQTVAKPAAAPAAPVRAPISFPYMLVGVILAGLLGAAAATAVGHRRHVPSAD